MISRVSGFTIPTFLTIILSGVLPLLAQDASTTAAALAKAPITFTKIDGESNDIDATALAFGDFNRDGQVDKAIVTNIGTVAVRLGLPNQQGDALYNVGDGANEIL